MSTYEDRIRAEVAGMADTRATAKASWAAWEVQRRQDEAEAKVLLREYARRFAHWASANGVRPTSGRYWVVQAAQTTAADDPAAGKYATKIIQVNPEFRIYADGQVSPAGTWVRMLCLWAQKWHRVDLTTLPPAPAVMPGNTEEEKAALAAINKFNATGKGYFIEQATRPETIGYALQDSPVALAAWMLDHDTDSYYKISHAFVDDKPSGNLTRDHILDNITLYWLTGTGTSAAREYWESGRAQASASGVKAQEPVKLPVGFTTFPGEIWKTPRSWVEKAYQNVIYFNEVAKGGHFAAWEEPELFASEIRAAFRPLRATTA